MCAAALARPGGDKRGPARFAGLTTIEVNDNSFSVRLAGRPLKKQLDEHHTGEREDQTGQAV